MSSSNAVATMNAAAQRRPVADRLDTSSGPDGCWPWQAAKDRLGYGYLSDNGKVRLAHRVAWTEIHGPIPAGMCICHRCDNPSCCNPAHLFLGTQGDNMRDMRAKGRGYLGGTPGEKHPSARLTAAQVLEARSRYALGGISYRELGALYGVSGQAMGHAVRRESWRCLGE